MPSAVDHERICRKMLGRSFPEVDEYLDQFSASLEGDSHRQMLHHTEGVEEVRRVFSEKWGSELGNLAAEAAQIHIKADFGIDYIPTPNEVRFKLQGFTQSN